MTSSVRDDAVLRLSGTPRTYRVGWTSETPCIVDLKRLERSLKVYGALLDLLNEPSGRHIGIRPSVHQSLIG